MKKFFKVFLFLGIFIGLGKSGMLPVHAQMQVHTYELTEEERYNPKYYRPLSEQEARFGARKKNTLESLEEYIVNALKNREEEIFLTQYEIDADSFFEYYYRMLNEHVELFFLKSTSSYKSIPSGSETIMYSLLPEYSMDVEEEKRLSAEIEKAAQEALSYVSDDMEDYEKALVIHDWIASYCAYDYENFLLDGGEGLLVPEESHALYGALVNRVAVCDSYAKAYRYIMNDKLNIPCYVTTSDEIHHAWNVIQIGGKYYHVDITWDDPTWDRIGMVNHNNFLLSAEGIMGNGHVGWNSPFEADDNSFEHALWTTSAGSVIYQDGYWYYVNQAQNQLLKTKDILDGSTETLYTFDLWMATSNTNWVGAYSYPQKFRNKLIFNGPKKIYCMPFDTEEVTELYAPADIPQDTESEVYNLFGFRVEGDNMEYMIYSTAAQDSDLTERIESAELPFERLSGTVSIEGEARYGNRLTAQVESESEALGQLVYSWYRDGIKIRGADTASYQLVKEDIGKVISVCAYHDDYLGVLKADTPAVLKGIADLVTVMPEYDGALGKPLSSIQLEEGYRFAKPDTIMSKVGDYTYDVYVCPDEELYEEQESKVLVHVACTKHNWEQQEVLTDPTCVKEGTAVYVCTYCGETEERSIAATGKHTWGKGVVVKSPTCHTEGITSYTCSICGETRQNKTAPTGKHSWDKGSVIKAATCSTVGSIRYTCVFCGAKYQKTIAATGKHNWNQGVVTKVPTYTQTGVRTYTCTVCKKTKTESVPRLQAPSVGTDLSYGNLMFQVTKSGISGGTVSFTGVKKSSETVSIPSTITVDDITYQVTSVADFALRNNKKVKKVVIGSHVSIIGKEAFYGCRKLKSILIQSKKIGTVQKNAVKNIHKKAVIKCPSKKVKFYQKLFGKKYKVRKK